MSPVSKGELYAAIRRDARSGLGKRALQRKHGVGFRTVTAALESVWPEPRKAPAARGSRLDEFKPVIDSWLRYDLSAPRNSGIVAPQFVGGRFDLVLVLGEPGCEGLEVGVQFAEQG